MNELLNRGNWIKHIRNGEYLDELTEYILNQLYMNGAENIVIMELVSYIKLFQPEYFKKIEQEILLAMGLFFKHPQASSLRAFAFKSYGEGIQDVYSEFYTPVQFDISRKIDSQHYFSFSAPTSTGKSYVFRNLIKDEERDSVIIVPSRALINEYYRKICEIVSLKEVSVLTFVDDINRKHRKRHVFILTPERARDLFKNKSWLDISFVLFDEAQLGNEKSTRGLYFDSIVRRIRNTFPDTKLIFAQPFIKNPEAQFVKNKLNLDDKSSKAMNYPFRNVGQIFYIHDETSDCFYHVGTDRKVLGKSKIPAEFDPIEQAILKGKSILIYSSKKGITDNAVFKPFKRYIDMCDDIKDEGALAIIKQLQDYIGASDKGEDYHSMMIYLLKKGIVVHHGSMPLVARQLMEEFTRANYCRMCFATSTLEQGINMPFDVVFLYRLESSKPLAVKNLIGRAGRSTSDAVFDVGSVVVKSAGDFSKIRNILAKGEELEVKSNLDEEEDDDRLDPKYNEFKRAINEGTFNDDYNLTDSDLSELRKDKVISLIPRIESRIFDKHGIKNNLYYDDELMEYLMQIYSYYLKRELNDAEKIVLDSAFRILCKHINGMNFGQICRSIYYKVSQMEMREALCKYGHFDAAAQLKVSFYSGYKDIPNKNLKKYSKFNRDMLAKDVSYDAIVYDVYDFWDKLIGFKLSDLYYAVFKQYSDSHRDLRAYDIALLFKYGTCNRKRVWLLRYGFTFEDIRWLEDHVESIDENEIIFRDIDDFTTSQLETIRPYYSN